MCKVGGQSYFGSCAIESTGFAQVGSLERLHTCLAAAALRGSLCVLEMPSGLSLALLMIAIAMLSTIHGVRSNTNSKDSNTGAPSLIILFLPLNTNVPGVDAKDAEIARLRVKVERLRADLHSSNDQEDQWMSESGPNAKDKNGPRRNGVAYYCQHDASKSSYYANCDTCVSTPIW